MQFHISWQFGHFGHYIIMYNIFFILYLCFLYHYLIVILSFSQYCQICYNLICCTIFNQNFTHVMLQIVLELLFFRWSYDIDIHVLFGLLVRTDIIIFYYLCVVYNNLSLKYQLCLDKLFSVSVSVYM